MQSQSPSKPPCTPDDAKAVLLRLRDAGHEAYFAGGCVRDLLLGRTPKDWDVATDAPPERVRQLFANTQAVGAAFGVILVRQRKSVVEVATFRADAPYADGRHPTSVRFTSAREDAQRRDFTINGLFLDPLRPGELDAQVIDYVGGRADLHARLIRAIGDPQARFAEDHLRLLRAVRFAARFGFSIAPDTAQAIRQHAPRLLRISPERICDELRTMLTPPTRTAAFALLDELNLRKVIFRSSTEPAALALEESIFMALSPGESIPFGLALAGWFVDEQRRQGAIDVRELLQVPRVKSAVRFFRQHLKISNEESDEVQGTLADLAPLLADAPPTVAQLKRFLAKPTCGLSRQLLAALARTAVIDAQRASDLQLRLAELEQSDFAPPPLITGDDLTAAGQIPGPRFKQALDATYDAQLENRVTTREQALRLAMEIFARS